jgi:Astacin (Peptidase family M12A)
MDLIAEATCIRFASFSGQRDFVTFTGNATKCSSKIGRQGGEQLIKLLNHTVGEGCFQIGSVLHEIMHALGFYHIHKTPGRDKYISIIWENVNELGRIKLKKVRDDLTDFGVGYDEASIMHYHSKSFAINEEEDTMVSRRHPVLTEVMGQREKLSKRDVLRIRRMYNCDGDYPEQELTSEENRDEESGEEYED